MKKEIKAFFKSNPRLKIKSNEICKKLHLKKDYEFSELKEILFSLTQEGYLQKIGKRYQLSENIDNELIGIFQLSREATYGFVIIKDSKMNDVFIPEKHFGSAMNGDKVRIELISKKRGKNIEGRITEIIERKHTEFTGKLRKKNSHYFVYPDPKDILKDIYIDSADLNGAEDGDKVKVGFINWEEKSVTLRGKIVTVLGKEGLYSTEMATIANEFKFDIEFPEEVLGETELFSEEISPQEIDSRLDLRNEIVFTIDPADAKDFDDALSITASKDSFRVGIHIADVSHFINKDTTLFAEAAKRATSVYLVGTVIPMLPEKLSNNICSLVPGKDRLTYSVITELDRSGKVLNYSIRKTVINSKRRFTYDEVQKILDDKDGEYYHEINMLNNLARSLRKSRMKKGSINFITPEIKFELDDKGKPSGIVLKEVKESHQLIEDYMLLANQIVAAHFNKKGNKNKLPFVYRIHDEPEIEKIQEFERFVRTLGYMFNSGAKNKSKEMQKLLEQAKDSVEESVVNEIAIRSMAKAVYSVDNIGHYGLGFKYYTHFTSPIRRFPDLIVHKLLYKYLENDLPESYSLKELNEICNHSSAQERNAISAERMSIKLKQLQYLENKINTEFNGVISGVTHFGIFIELTENLAEGLIRLRDIENDFYIFDERHYSITGRNSGKTLRLGDRVKVKLKRVDLEKRELDFALIE